MISAALFNVSIKDSIKLLKKINLYKNVGPKNIGQYSDDFRKVCRNNKHIEIYNTIRDNLDYEIILSDDSFFQFSIGKNYLRFSFIENPSFNYTKYDYLKICFPEEDIYSFSDEEINEMINENEFEQFINEQEINSNLMYVRYDYDEKGYKPLLHSYSHIHIGLNENLRIPSSIVLTPLQFVLFCIKQSYYDVWKLHQETFDINDIAAELLKSKKQCPKITDIDIWNTIEKNEIYIA
jgi:hypothetical protein